MSNLKWIFITVLALIWGSSFILMKRGLMHFTADQVAALRIFTAFLVSFPWVAHQYKSIEKRKLKYIAVVGIFGSGLPAVLFTSAQVRINSSVAGMLNSLTPLFTVLVGVFFFRSRFTLLQILGVMAGLLGASGLIFVNAEGDFSLDAGYAMLIVIACICYGISVNTIKAYLSEINALTISGFSLLLVGIPYGIYLFSTDFTDRLQADKGAWEGVLYIVTLAVFGTAISNILYFRLVKIASPLFASAVTYLIPIVALMWGIADGEKLNLLHIPAMLAILGGVGMISWEGYRKRRNSS